MLFRNSLYIYITVVGFPATAGCGNAAYDDFPALRLVGALSSRQAKYGEYKVQQEPTCVFYFITMQ